jgi:hypothetical protein
VHVAPLLFDRKALTLPLSGFSLPLFISIMVLALLSAPVLLSTAAPLLLRSASRFLRRALVNAQVVIVVLVAAEEHRP